MGPYMKPRIYILTDTKIKIGSISFENPIWVASGTFGYGTEILTKGNSDNALAASPEF